MTALLDSHCPCQSRKTYGECCGRFHSYAQFPETAEQLMRSRYAAYVLKNVPYIVETTVPSQQKLLNVQSIQTWAENTQWLGLQILNTETLTKVQSAVEFNAVFQGEDSEQAHNERSIFVKIDGRWYFVDPTVPLPTMKQPCVCGSDKKFKHCCGGLL
ncbi:YchJ family protein [Aggregatibacter actinomycetemcomitans]|uniref:YchJ family protein n=1 Tax=Aggregatibacter actinomycetemcomitans TaxID=714 RepID=UPI00197BD9EA|nr:YchJ family protein [Aggregatibacter actinomycetemcomitans]MBN6063854.1 YchJ family protein [Aggregatibacter actinomycetemcomitans]MBN6082021.1 YchJ family protein [Aggregatibacter actinomycetemcomitans]MBN6083756.1 YchJ family protein [Aggregatibacter actinomycetemcomitans]